MSYRVETTSHFDREFKKLDKPIQKMLASWIKKNLIACDNPRAFGKAMTADKSGFWRYRIGNYRLICEIHDDELLIVAMSVGHRQGIYKH